MDSTNATFDGGGGMGDDMTIISGPLVQEKVFLDVPGCVVTFMATRSIGVERRAGGMGAGGQAPPPPPNNLREGNIPFALPPINHPHFPSISM